MLALLGIALLQIGGFTYAYSFFGVLNGNVLVAAGAVIDVGADLDVYDSLPDQVRLIGYGSTPD